MTCQKGRGVATGRFGQSQGSSAKEPLPRHSFPAIWPGALGALILLVAIFPTMPEDYYDYFLPFAVGGLGAVMIVIAVRCRRWWWIAPFIVLALFFNPIPLLKPGLGSRFLWQLADFAGAVLFLLGAYFIYPKPGRVKAETP